MPGFLKVYGYYSPTLKKWNIDVSYESQSNYLVRITDTPAANCSTIDLVSYDNWNFLGIAHGWTPLDEVRSPTWTCNSL